MAELIDVPTCNPFGTADCCGSSGLPEPSPPHLIKANLECVRQRDRAARSKLKTLQTFPHRLLSGGWRFLKRFLSWLGRILSDVDIHHWQAHLH